MSAVTGKTIVHLPNWLGDMVMAAPFLQSLKGMTDGELWGLGKSSAMQLLNGLHIFDRYVPMESKDPIPFLDLARDLKGVRFHRGFLLPHSFRSALLFFLAGVEERIGYARNHRGFMHTRAVSEVSGIEPTVEHYLRIIDTLGGRRLSESPALTVTVEEEGRFFQDFPHLSQPFAALIPGAQYGPSKRWPESHFARLADLLAERHGIPVLILPGKGEEALAKTIGAQTKEGYPVEVLSMGVQDLKVCLSRASVVVTNDTGPRHISAALRVPTVVLMGPMDDRYTGYPSPFVHILSKDVPCRPCNRKVCSGNHECLAAITPEEVAEVVTTILTEDRAVTAATAIQGPDGGHKGASVGGGKRA